MNFNEKRILGMIHLSQGTNYSTIVDRALEEISIYEEEGLYGCIVENYHGSVQDVENVLKALSKQKRSIKIGINILPNYYEKAFSLGDQYNVDFIQLDFVSGKYERTEKIDIEHYLVSKNSHKYKPFILGGVWPKYYTPKAGSILADDIEDAVSIFSCDGIVVTGAGTGKETPIDKIKSFGELINGRVPLIIGAGVDAWNVAEQLKYANGAIVGSCFKKAKRTQEMVNRKLVKEFMNSLNKVK